MGKATVGSAVETDEPSVGSAFEADRSGSEASAGRRTVKITLVVSPTGFNKSQAKVVQGMGLRRIGHTVELIDSPETRGMILKVRHLVKVQE